MGSKLAILVRNLECIWCAAFFVTREAPPYGEAGLQKAVLSNLQWLAGGTANQTRHTSSSLRPHDCLHLRNSFVYVIVFDRISKCHCCAGLVPAARTRSFRVRPEGCLGAWIRQIAA